MALPARGRLVQLEVVRHPSHIGHEPTSASLLPVSKTTVAGRLLGRRGAQWIQRSEQGYGSSARNSRFRSLRSRSRRRSSCHCSKGWSATISLAGPQGSSVAHISGRTHTPSGSSPTACSMSFRRYFPIPTPLRTSLESLAETRQLNGHSKRPPTRLRCLIDSAVNALPALHLQTSFKSESVTERSVKPPAPQPETNVPLAERPSLNHGTTGRDA